MHSAAIFFGFLIGTFGLGCCLIVAVALWQSRHDGDGDTAPYARWIRPVLALTMFPVPILLAVGGGAALYWGFVGA
jgi:hypothetical protein